jgi:hypothetical protein
MATISVSCDMQVLYATSPIFLHATDFRVDE